MGHIPVLEPMKLHGVDEAGDGNKLLRRHLFAAPHLEQGVHCGGTLHAVRAQDGAYAVWQLEEQLRGAGRLGLQ